MEDELIDEVVDSLKAIVGETQKLQKHMPALCAMGDAVTAKTVALLVSVCAAMGDAADGDGRALEALLLTGKNCAEERIAEGG